MGLDAHVYRDDEWEDEMMHLRIGNVWLVGELQAELQAAKSALPVLLNKVLYSGAHCGDELRLAEVLALRTELEELKSWPASDRHEIVERLRVELSALCDVAIEHRRPIVF